MKLRQNVVLDGGVEQLKAKEKKKDGRRKLFNRELR